MGKLSFENGKYYFSVTETMRDDKRARGADFKWCGDTLRWVTRNPGKARLLRRFADESAERKLKLHYITEFPPPEQISYPDHLEPRSWQVESAWHIVTRSPAYNADEAGLGKTITAALCMNSVPGKTLIICPPFLRYNWANEINKWVSRDECGVPHVTIMEGGKFASNDAHWNVGVVILPDSLLINPLVQSMIAEHKWEWLFVDEAHRYKEDKTQRTKALLEKVITHAKRICYLSGTPIPNGRPIELYPLLSRSAPESISWRSPEQFGKDFCAAKRVVHHERGRPVVQWDFSGASNLKQLRSELRKKLLIRHLKRDVMEELGPKTRNIIFLDEVKSLESFEHAALKDMSLDELMGEDHELGDIATYRRKVGEAKLQPAIEYITDLLENGVDKLVVFAHHIDVVGGLYLGLQDFGSLMIRGGVGSKAKHATARRFQESSKHRVIIGNMEAMGVGLTLTSAPGVVVVEPDWRPGINEQAEDRVHRMTQNQNVYVRYLVLRNSLDERMLTQVLDKQDAINEVMN